MDFGRFSGRLVCAVFVGDEIYGVLFVCLFVCLFVGAVGYVSRCAVLMF